MSEQVARARPSLARLATEVVAIVASILLAFALDAWWDARALASQEQDLLGRLDEELLATDSALVEWQAGHLRVAEAGRLLLGQTDARPSPSLSTDSIRRLVGATTSNFTVDPPTGVLNSAISTGQLGLIGNEELQAALAGWPATLDDLRANEDQLAGVVFSRLIPYLDEHIAWRAHNSMSLGPTSFAEGIVDLLAQREFENLMIGRVAVSESVARQYDIIRSRLAHLRSLIDQALDNTT